LLSKAWQVLQSADDISRQQSAHGRGLERRGVTGGVAKLDSCGTWRPLGSCPTQSIQLLPVSSFGKSNNFEMIRVRWRASIQSSASYVMLPYAGLYTSHEAGGWQRRRSCVTVSRLILQKGLT